MWTDPNSLLQDDSALLGINFDLNTLVVLNSPFGLGGLGALTHTTVSTPYESALLSPCWQFCAPLKTRDTHSEPRKITSYFD